MAIVQGTGGGGGTYTPPKTTLKTPQQILDDIIKQQQKVNPYLTPTQRLGTPTTPTAPKPVISTPSTPIAPTPAPAPKPSPTAPTPSNTAPIVAATTNTQLPGFTTGWDSLPETTATKDVNSITGAMPTGSMQTYTEPEFDPKQYIQELLAEQRRQQLAALGAAQTRALTGLNTTRTGKQTALDTAKNNYLTNLDTALQSGLENIANEEAKIDPYYYDLRNQAQGQSDVGALNFAQYMAGRGIKGNAGAMPEIYRNAALQGQMGGLNRQQAANQAEIDRMRTTTQNQYGSNKANVLNNYEADLAGLEREYLTNRQGMMDAYEQDRISAQAGLDAQGLQAFIDQMNADRLFSLNEAGITGTYGGTPTLAGQEFQQKLDDKAKASYLDTIGRFGDNYQAEIDRVQGDNDTTNDWQIPYLQAERQKKVQNQAEQTAAQAAAAGEAEKEQYKQAFDLWKAYGTANEQIATILGVPVGARTADFNIDSINAATSSKNADTAAQNANTAQQKTETSSNLNGYVDYITANFGNDKASITAYLESLMTAGVDDATINALAEKYGL